MTKCAFAAVIGLLSLCLPLAAQDETITSDDLRTTGKVDVAPALTLYRPDIFSTVDGSVLIHGLPVLSLLDGRRFPISGSLGRMGMTGFDLGPVAFLSAVEVQRVNPSPMHGTDHPGGIVNLQLNRVYVGGEAGVFYGKSGGKYGREDFHAYIIGGVGNDKLQITAGAAYQESNGRIYYPRR